MTISAVIVSRNDNYGGHLNERATYAINSAIDSFDEVIYVDWNSENGSLLYDIKEELQFKGNLKHIVIPPHDWRFSRSQMVVSFALGCRLCRVVRTDREYFLERERGA